MRDAGLQESMEPFACPVACRAVYVHRVWKILPDDGCAGNARVAVKTTCEYQDHCVIAKYDANGITYDWERCGLVNASKPSGS